MKIHSREELIREAGKVLEEIGMDARYPQSREALKSVGEIESLAASLPEAMLELAEALLEADPVHPMPPELARFLISLYEDCIEAGSAEAMCSLGALYYKGRGGEQDYEKAAHYYEMAEKAGNLQAAENLGYIWYYGRTGKRDYEKAFQYFIKGALLGNLRSLYKIGDFYRHGLWVDQDQREAFALYGRCVQEMTGEEIPLVGADVYLRMGECFLEGIGTEADPLSAQRFLSMAENLFYQRLMEGDFYQKNNLARVRRLMDEARKAIEEMLPDLCWSGYEE